MVGLPGGAFWALAAVAPNVARSDSADSITPMPMLKMSATRLQPGVPCCRNGVPRDGVAT